MTGDSTDDGGGRPPAADRRDDGATPENDGPAADPAAPAEVEQVAREYEAAGRPFARVTVVRREPPASANVGDRAVVTPEGDLVGWVGGVACARSVAVEEARAALESGEPRLVGLAPDPDDVDRPGVESYPMTCHSGGTLELFVEPVRPVPRLVVVGDSAIAAALARLAGETSYRVTVVSGADRAAAGGDTDETTGGGIAGADETVAVGDPDAVAAAVDGAQYVVVASMGEYDDVGVAAALRAGVPYVGLVASDARRDELAGTVADRLGVAPDAVVEAVTTPVGLDVGARTPEEIAVSILAELVAVRRGADGPVPVDVGDASAVDVDEGADSDPNATRAADGETAVDPVCGMDVVVGEAAATVEYGGETYHFCGQGCADAFADDPEEYLGEVAAGE